MSSPRLKQDPADPSYNDEDVEDGMHPVELSNNPSLEGYDDDKGEHRRDGEKQRRSSVWIVSLLIVVGAIAAVIVAVLVVKNHSSDSDSSNKSAKGTQPPNGENTDYLDMVPSSYFANPSTVQWTLMDKQGGVIPDDKPSGPGSFASALSISADGTRLLIGSHDRGSRSAVPSRRQNDAGHSDELAVWCHQSGSPKSPAPRCDK